MSNVLGRITVQVSTGETFHSAWREETAEAEEYAREVLSRVSDMGKFEIESDKGYTVYINPAHIVYAYLEIDEEI